MFDTNSLYNGHIGSIYRINRGNGGCLYNTIKKFSSSVINEQNTIDDTDKILIVFNNQNEKNEVDNKLKEKINLIKSESLDILSKKLDYYINRLSIYECTVEKNLYNKRYGDSIDLSCFYVPDGCTMKDYDDTIEEDEYEDYDNNLKNLLVNEYKLKYLVKNLRDLMNKP